MTVSFVTPGLIDLQAAFTFGMSAKEGENPIGFFGTGFKYAVATLLRTGHQIEIIVGGTHHSLTIDSREYRGKDFNVISLDGVPLGFTTQLGRLWEPWMAFRELHSNTLDEKGCTYNKKIDCDDSITVISIEGDGIEKSWRERGTIFCDKSPIAKNSIIEVMFGKSNYLYYRGVRSMELKNPSMLTYNLLESMILTEDRTIKSTYLAEAYVAVGLSTIEDENLIADILTAPEGTYESCIDYTGCEHPSEQFVSTIRKCIHDKFLNKSAYKLGLKLAILSETDIELDEIQKQQLKKATSFLERLGFQISRYPIIFREMTHGQHGLAKNGTIYIAPQAFRMGTKYLASTIYEEFLHLSEGVYDRSREMQTILFDTIMTMGEKITGSPL